MDQAGRPRLLPGPTPPGPRRGLPEVPPGGGPHGGRDRPNAQPRRARPDAALADRPQGRERHPGGVAPMSTDRPETAPDHGGSGPLLVRLIGFAVLCAGSVGGGAYFIWRATRVAADRAEEARAELRAAAAQAEQDATTAGLKFERVAKAVADGLAAPDRLADSYTADGKPLLSWRVHLLPRLGEA